MLLAGSRILPGLRGPGFSHHQRTLTRKYIRYICCHVLAQVISLAVRSGSLRNFFFFLFLTNSAECHICVSDLRLRYDSGPLWSFTQRELVRD